MLVERTVSRWQGGQWESNGEKLSDFRSARAYVLLAEPGAGKSTCFEQEDSNSDRSVAVTARRLLRRRLDDHPEWRDTTLFIDGLDEVRVGGGDLREPIDSLVRRLEALGNPRFRLSCREDSWLGQGDFLELSSVTDTEEIHIFRLDPLTDDDTDRILEAAGVPNPDRFWWKAMDSGLEAFLRNPLLLDILIKANDSGSWPEGRLATFASPCEALVRESNREHLDARDGQPFAVEEVVLAAGRLCSLLLLCGNSGWSRRGPGDDECPALSEAGDEQPLLKFSLDTKLFGGGAETGRRPRHRNIAEFLAASYLEHSIRSGGLSARRVLAWMQGIDGRVVPDLRGVSLWLAARIPAVRRSVIESDPVGVAYHGDAEHFSAEDTALLFRALEAELEHQLLTGERDRDSSSSLGALIAGPGRDILYDMLGARDRSEVRLHLIERLLRGLGEATLREIRSGDPGSEDARRRACTALDAIVRDPSWRSSVRSRALIELTRVFEDRAKDPSILLDLLHDLAEGEISEDNEEGLALWLLDSLYPRHLGPQQFWECIEQLWTAPQRDAESSLDAKYYWARRLVIRLASEDVRLLLETLVRNAQRLNKVLAESGMADFVARLLTRGLRQFGEELDPAELYEWFELVEVRKDSPSLVLAHCGELPRSTCGDLQWEFSGIYDWLHDHRDIQLSLISEELTRSASFPRDHGLDRQVSAKFVGDKVPPGFRRWCLEKAVALAVTQPASAIELVFWATTTREAWGRPLDDAQVLTEIRDTPFLREWYEQRTIQSEPGRKSQPASPTQERQPATAVPIHQHLLTIEAGEGPPEILHELGRVFLEGFQAGNEKRGRAALAIHLGGHDGMLETVTRGFRNVVKRTDLPTLEEIASLHGRGQPSTFGAPFLAGLVEEARASGWRLEHLDEAELRRALAFYLLSGQHSRPHPIPVSFKRTVLPHLERPEEPRPGWYHHAVENCPQTVADAFVAVNRARVRAGDLPDQHLYDLAWEPVDGHPGWELDYCEVAPLAVPRMFAAFPNRCTRAQVESLRLVLWAALKYMPHDDLRSLVLTKLRRIGMDHAQRGTWLGAGLFLDREACLPKVVEFLSRGTKRRRYALVNFLVPFREPLPEQGWPTTDLVTLIKVMGAKLTSSSYSDLSPFGWRLLSLLEEWLATLAERVDDETVAALRDLADNPTLKSCRGTLLRARDRQAKERRISNYKAPSIAELRGGLRGGPPISAADLAALVSDKLSELASRIRDGNTDAWQQYWHTDPGDPKGRKVIKPKAEEPCRDALLSGLQLLLGPQEVDAQPEGHHAEDARSDIIAIHGNHAVVIEVKKTDSKDLWSAMTDQLIAKYARDPRSGGYGIFLVFWFGANHLKEPPPIGPRPRSPEELDQVLKGLLTQEQRQTITIIVVDVAAPRGRVAPRFIRDRQFS